MLQRKLTSIFNKYFSSLQFYQRALRLFFKRLKYNTAYLNFNLLIGVLNILICYIALPFVPVNFILIVKRIKKIYEFKIREIIIELDSTLNDKFYAKINLLLNFFKRLEKKHLKYSKTVIPSVDVKKCKIIYNGSVCKWDDYIYKLYSLEYKLFFYHMQIRSLLNNLPDFVHFMPYIVVETPTFLRTILEMNFLCVEFNDRNHLISNEVLYRENPEQYIEILLVEQPHSPLLEYVSGPNILNNLEIDNARQENLIPEISEASNVKQTNFVSEKKEYDRNFDNDMVEKENYILEKREYNRDFDEGMIEKENPILEKREYNRNLNESMIEKENPISEKREYIEDFEEIIVEKSEFMPSENPITETFKQVDLLEQQQQLLPSISNSDNLLNNFQTTTNQLDPNFISFVLEQNNGVYQNMLHLLTRHYYSIQEIYPHINAYRTYYDYYNSVPALTIENYTSIAEKIMKYQWLSDPQYSLCLDVHRFMNRYEYYLFNCRYLYSSHSNPRNQLDLLKRAKEILNETHLYEFNTELSSQVYEVSAYSADYVRDIDLIVQTICTVINFCVNSGAL